VERKNSGGGVMADGRCGGRVVLPLGTLSLFETVAVLSG